MKIKLLKLLPLAAVGSTCLFSGCQRHEVLQTFYETHPGDNLYDLDSILLGGWTLSQGPAYMMTTNLNADGETYMFFGQQVKVFRIR